MCVVYNIKRGLTENKENSAENTQNQSKGR